MYYVYELVVNKKLFMCVCVCARLCAFIIM